LSVLQEYKCPNCNGAIQFDSNIQKMRCPYCDAEFDMQAVASLDETLNNAQPDSMNWNTQAGGTWQEGETDGLNVYVCNSCGGEVVGDATTAATHCPYCDNPVVMMGQFAGALRPDIVIPFKKDKKMAIAALKKHYEGKKLLPSVFKNENHIKEVKGVYVPFWLFDADVQANVQYKATTVRTWKDSNYRYTETSYFAVNRAGYVAFDSVPVDGSTKMDDKLMESVEPFNINEAVDFQTAYLAGYLADKYDVSAEESVLRANERIKKSTEDAFLSTVNGYDSVTTDFSQINLQNGRARYALYPVWILNTEWRGNKYTFAVNGQTGKVVGDLPMDKGKYKRWLFGTAAVVGAIAFAVQYLLWLL